MWASFLRERLTLYRSEWLSAKLVARAVQLAHGRDAAQLPGWSGKR